MTNRLSESESVALGILILGASIVVLSWATGAAHLTIRPLPILVGAAIGAAALWRAVVGRPSWTDWSPGRLAGFLFICVACFTYFCWLAWPSLLPISEGPDLVHHLTLVHFIQQRHVLPHGHSFGAYLGEMDGYTPGSHLLAALVADCFGVDGLRVVHPLTAAAVALKAGIIYNVILRLLPEDRQSAAAATSGTLLLLVPHAYLLRSFTHFQFFAQVIAETFAIAMLWAIVVWYQKPARRWLAAFALLGVAVFLCWPVWLPAPALTLALAAVVKRGRLWRRTVLDLIVAGGPIAALAAVYTGTHTRSASVLASGGATVVPSLAIFGWPFLGLAVWGLVLAVRQRVQLAPLLAFGAACLLQIGGLVMLQWRLGASNFYLAYKTVHLLVYPAVVLAALALEDVWPRLSRLIPGGERRLRWLLPVVVIAGLMRSDLPRRPIPSPITEPVHRAGLWARAHLPSACVDYLVEHWVTAYWLHVDVLGNPRPTNLDSGRFGYRPTVGRWIESGSLPYAIAGDVDALPVDLRPNMTVVVRFGPAAVIERIDGRSRCDDNTPPIHRLR